MFSARPNPRRVSTLIVTAALAATALTGCGSDEEKTSEGSSATNGAWPRTFTNADGTSTTIDEAPERILSTSVTTTGTLLAIDAPVVASGSAGNGQFFGQWADVAEERGVENVWAAGSVDLESVIATDPDLIVVAATGADSALDQVKAFQDVAPTIVVDYGGQTWQELAGELAEATGLEDEAEEAVEAFDAKVAEVAEQIEAPAGAANIVSFNGAGEDNPIARKGSVHGKLLTDLGFTVEDPDVKWHTQPQAREDFVWTAFENLTQLKGETTFVLTQDDKGAQAFAQDKTLANLPSVKAGQVYGLGLNSFRIDMYSAGEIVDAIADRYTK